MQRLPTSSGLARMSAIGQNRTLAHAAQFANILRSPGANNRPFFCAGTIRSHADTQPGTGVERKPSSRSAPEFPPICEDLITCNNVF